MSVVKSMFASVSIEVQVSPWFTVVVTLQSWPVIPRQSGSPSKRSSQAASIWLLTNVNWNLKNITIIYQSAVALSLPEKSKN